MPATPVVPALVSSNGVAEMLTTRLTARGDDRKGDHGIIDEIISKRMACRIKSLFGEEEKELQFESKDCARNLAKCIDSQKEADLNRHQQAKANTEMVP
jgi:hypothetical protein